MSDVKSLSSPLRIDTSTVSKYLYADKPQLTGWQKFSRTLGKLATPFLSIGSAVTAFVCPPVAAGLYGLARVTSDATNAALSRDVAKLNAYNQEVAQRPITLPGLFEGLSEAEITTDFIAPSEYQSGIQQLLIDRQAMVIEGRADLV